MQTIIEIKNLRKIYKDNKVALDDVNLNIFKGEIIALLGPNGAGKTTLLQILGTITSPSKNEKFKLLKYSFKIKASFL